MEFEGIITMMWKEETVWQNNLKKLTFVLEEDTDKEYKGSVAIDIFGDKIEMISWFKQGDKVKAGINLRAREYNGRRFNGVSARRVDKSEWATANSNPSAPADDDLPF
jgi:single-stranded DNA-binding protein